MALPFNPFDKPTPKAGTKKAFTKVKVFERADFEIKKLETNLEQTENKPETELQTVPKTNVEQTENKLETAIGPTRNKPETELQTVPKTNVEQTENKLETKQGFSSVVGIQRKILDYFFEKSQSLGSLLTGNIFPEVLAESLACSTDTVRTSIQRMEKKGLIFRKEYKAGRGGFSIFEIEKSTYQNLVFANKHKTNLGQTWNKPQTKPQTELQTKGLNSSSDLKLEDKELRTIPIPENLKTMISQREVQNLLEKGLMEDDLRQSLEHFSYDIQHNLVRSKTSPLNLFFGLCRSNQKYKSLKLLEQENADLKKYQDELNKLEQERRELQAVQNKERYEEFKKQNPSFIEKIKLENPFVSQNNELADKMGLMKFIESNP